VSNNPSTLARGNITGSWVIAPTLSPVAVAANTTAEQTFTLKGMRLGDFVSISKPTTQAGLGIVNARVSALDTLAVAFVNATGSSITPTASEIYTLLVSRPENVTMAGVSPLAVPG
jgi:hypothetical protein